MHPCLATAKLEENLYVRWTHAAQRLATHTALANVQCLNAFNWHLQVSSHLQTVYPALAEGPLPTTDAQAGPGKHAAWRS